MDLYTKEGRRYKKVGTEFFGFPSNGVWVVHDGRQSLISKLGELPNPMPLAAIQRHERVAIKALLEISKGPHSISDLWNAICKAIAEKEQETKI